VRNPSGGRPDRLDQTVKQAAVEVGKRYRYIWGRIKEAVQRLGQSLVETHVGEKGTHRSFLTPIACHLVRNFLAMRGRLYDLVREEYNRRFRDVGACLLPSFLEFRWLFTTKRLS
jgi:molybdate transport repressor ModE-like protein